MPALLFRTIAIAVCLLTSLSAARAEDNGSITYEPKTTGQGKHIVLMAGDEEYRSEEALPMLAKILSNATASSARFSSRSMPMARSTPNKSESLSNPAALGTADAIIIVAAISQVSGGTWPSTLPDAIERGVPVIGLRTSTHAFSGVQGKYKDLNRFGKDVLGEQWVSHWGRHKAEATRGVVEPGRGTRRC